jgi:hypothetical protein
MNKEKYLEKLKKELGKQVLAYDRCYSGLDMDCSEKLAIYISSELNSRVLVILKTIEELKKLELEINGKIPAGLQICEEEFKAKLVI